MQVLRIFFIKLRRYTAIWKQLLIANDTKRVPRAAQGLSQDGACTDSFENFRENSLKGDLSNNITLNTPLYSLVNTFNNNKNEKKWQIKKVEDTGMEGTFFGNRRKKPNFLPCPAEVQTAVELAVELCVVDVQGEGEGEGCLHLLLEVGQPLGHLHRVLVKHELHQVRVLQHKDLEQKNSWAF